MRAAVDDWSFLVVGFGRRLSSCLCVAIFSTAFNIRSTSLYHRDLTYLCGAKVTQYEHSLTMQIETFIRDVPDFPKPGILFKDISPLLANADAFHAVVEKMAAIAKHADVIVAPDARGFLFGAPIAATLRKPLIMARKAGKLPGNVIHADYNLEYGHNHVEIQVDVLKAGQKAIIVDDVLATGGTTKAVAHLLTTQGLTVDTIVVLLELKRLNGRGRLRPHPVVALVEVD